MKGIAPKGKLKGFDICGMNFSFYIIRSDLDCYMKTTDLKTGANLVINKLNPSCKDGDHYIGKKNNSIYIIKGDSYRRVTDLTADSRSERKIIHPNYRGGDHYFSTMGKFYVIFKERGVYLRTSHLTSDSDEKEYKLLPEFSDGLYYWGRTFHFYMMKLNKDWGIEYHKGSNFSKQTTDTCNSVHPDILNFLPGGLSITQGEIVGQWMCIKTITNESDIPMEWKQIITRKVGYNKEKMTQVTHNWKINLSGNGETADILGLLAKCQISLAAEYGGSFMDTNTESWEKMTEQVEELSLTVPPYGNAYLWQYSLNLGSEPLLFLRDLKICSSPDPPNDDPLLPIEQ